MSDTRAARPDDHPASTSDRNVEAGVRDTFPASDPVSTTATMGARAVSVGQMQGSPIPDDATMVALHRHFPDMASAKLALETLVREAPIDRRMAQITAEDGGAALQIRVPPVDAARIGDLLEKQIHM